MVVSKVIVAGDFIDSDLASDIKCVLDYKSRGKVAIESEFAKVTAEMVLDGKRKITDNNLPMVMALIKAAKLKASDMAASGHRIYNELSAYADFTDNDVNAHKLAQDGKY